ncbi:MAG: 30S ribosomal protein S6 [Desulfopila sp.]
MRRYELIYILRPGLGEEQIEAITEYSTKIIVDESGSIIDLNKWGMKKLAYAIKKEIQGFYVYCEFAGTPAAVAEIERRFRIDDGVLKYLTIKTADSMTAEAIEQAIGETEAKKAQAEQAEREEKAEDADAPNGDDSAEDEN